MNATINKLTTRRFGTIEYEEADRIEFTQGIVGFPNLKSFLVLNVKEGSPFRWLQSIDDPAFAMLITNPAEFIQGYSPYLTAQDQNSVGLAEDIQPLLFVTVTIPSGRPEDLTLNLAGPLVIHPITRAGMQVVLPEDSYTNRHRVFPNTSEGEQKTAA